MGAELWLTGTGLTRQQIAQAGRTVFHFAEAYGAAAREQQGQTIPSRLPTENEVGVVIDNAMLAVEKLRDVRDMINRINTDRLRENGGRKGLDDDDTVMYGDGMKQAYSITEVKKRRGVSLSQTCHMGEVRG